MSTKASALGSIQFTRMGGERAELSVEDGAKTTVRLATLPGDGPSGGFFYMDDQLPW